MDREYQFAKLIEQVEKLHHRQELSRTVGPDYFEPGMMEYLDKSDGVYDPETGKLALRFEVKGTRYEGRTELMENVREGDAIRIVRDYENVYNSNNFSINDGSGKDLGNMPADLCNAIAPLFDDGLMTFQSAAVSYVEPVSKRSRHAKQAILFVETVCQLDFD